MLVKKTVNSQVAHSALESMTRRFLVKLLGILKIGDRRRNWKFILICKAFFMHWIRLIFVKVFAFFDEHSLKFAKLGECRDYLKSPGIHQNGKSIFEEKKHCPNRRWNEVKPKTFSTGMKYYVKLKETFVHHVRPMCFLFDFYWFVI